MAMVQGPAGPSGFASFPASLAPLPALLSLLDEPLPPAPPVFTWIPVAQACPRAMGRRPSRARPMGARWRAVGFMVGPG